MPTQDQVRRDDGFLLSLLQERRDRDDLLIEIVGVGLSLEERRSTFVCGSHPRQDKVDFSLRRR